MTPPPPPEVWLRGPVPGILPPLQPIAHALLQAKEEVQALMQDFPDALLAERPAGVASPAFHLQHLAGVLDRLFTYAAGHALSAEQLQALQAEGRAPEGGFHTAPLVAAFCRQVDGALQRLRSTAEDRLFEARAVGRAGLPSTVFGLLVHAAEHTMRHVGQLLVTVRMLNGSGDAAR